MALARLRVSILFEISCSKRNSSVAMFACGVYRVRVRGGKRRENNRGVDRAFALWFISTNREGDGDDTHV